MTNRAFRPSVNFPVMAYAVSGVFFLGVGTFMKWKESMVGRTPYVPFHAGSTTPQSTTPP
jgi:hypothetical protein